MSDDLATPVRPLRGAPWVDLVILAVYVALSLAMCFPLPLHLDTHIAGRYRDARIFQWNNWWVNEALHTGQDLNHTNYIFYPSGVSLASHNVNWVGSLLSVPLDALFGPTVAYNLTFLLTFFLPAFAMYLLVLYLVRRRDAAFVAGLVFAFFPYHVSGNWDGQMNLANIQWLPLCALFVLRTVDRKRIGDAMLAGAFYALAALDCWYFGIFLAIWSAVYLVYGLVFERAKWTWQVALLAGLAAVVGGVLVAPFLIPVIRQSAETSLDYAIDYYAEDKGTDLLAFLVPSVNHPLWSRYVAPIYARFQHWRPAFLGFLALALAIYAALAARRRSLLWVLCGLTFLVLALGTTLIVGGVEYPNLPMPYRGLSDWIPTLKVIRQSSRFNVMVVLSLAALVGIACADLLARLERRVTGRAEARARIGAVALASVLILFDYLAVPCLLTPEGISTFYRALAREEGDFAILELPLDDLNARRAMYPQMWHGKKLLSGYIARIPPGSHAFIHSNPLLKLLRIQMKPDPRVHDAERELNVLAANDIRYAVIHKTGMPPDPPLDEAVLASWREVFGPETVYEDDELVVYRVRPAPDCCLTPILHFGGQLGIVEVQARRTWTSPDPNADQALTIDLTWKALADLNRSYALGLSLSSADGTAVAQVPAEIISPRYPTSRWPPGVVVAEQYALPIDPALPPGEYTLSLAVADPSTGSPLGTAKHPVRVENAASPLVPALQDVQHPTEVTFGDEMRLLGHSSHQQGETLAVDLVWQALRAIQEQYVFFVHLIDPADGAIVAQHDAMPRDWSYPTSLWARREVFVDQVELDLSGVEPGSYLLAVGVYLPEGARLPVFDAMGQPIVDGRAILDGKVEVRVP